MPDVFASVDRARERALELGVYLPLGAYAAVKEQISELDAARVRKVFEDLVDRGQDRMQPVERMVRRRARKVEQTADDAAREMRKTAAKTTKRATAASAAVAPKLPRVAAPKGASELPITGYASLTASEIVSQLRGLTQTQLAKVYKYERANENRSTILEAIDTKLVDLPIPTYDALTVDEISERLDGLSADELKTLFRYESGTKARTTVMEKIDALLSA